MKILSQVRYLALCLTVFAVGCSSTTSSSDLSVPLAGGAAGAALGAGTGAIIGSVIANGDVPASALVGGVVGLAAGAAIAAVYQSSMKAAELSANNNRILENHEHIQQTELEMNQVREKLRSEAANMDVDPDTTEYIYTGPTLGAYNR